MRRDRGKEQDFLSRNHEPETNKLLGILHISAAVVNMHGFCLELNSGELYDDINGMPIIMMMTMCGRKREGDGQGMKKAVLLFSPVIVAIIAVL